MVGTTPCKVYGKQSWLIIALSPATTADIVEEKQPPGTLMANKLATKRNRAAELQGGTEMCLIGNKQLVLGAGENKQQLGRPCKRQV